MKTIDISGMGGSYENGCQKMLLNGLKWLKEHPTFDFSHAYKAYSGIYGMVTSQNVLAKELDQVTIGDLDATGAMHQAVVSHLAYIHKHGHDQWIAELEKKGRRVYETDEAAIDNEIMAAQKELAELRKKVPAENIISFD